LLAQDPDLFTRLRQFDIQPDRSGSKPLRTISKFHWQSSLVHFSFPNFYFLLFPSSIFDPIVEGFYKLGLESDYPLFVFPPRGKKQKLGKQKAEMDQYLRW
jgi:hypothetical protein